MPAITTMEVTERLSAMVVTAPSAGCGETCGHDGPVKKIPVLPRAIQDDEITEGDFSLLFRIAEDSNAPRGRLRRPTSSFPAVKTATN